MNDERPWTTYTLLLLFIAGMGGFLYGYDIGIIGAALLYLGKTIDLTLREESLVVAAVLGGGMFSSLIAGGLADFIGRKKVMILSGILFVASVWLIVVAQSFVPLFLGRGLQGLSAGMIAVVIPLYLAESLPAAIRGRGTGAFQLMLTVGIFIAGTVGTHYTRRAEMLTASAVADQIRAIQSAAWRDMFRSALYPGIVFLLGAFLVRESPRWPIAKEAAPLPGAAPVGSLLQRKYVVPFLLACAVLALNQATGINSVLQFVVVILQHAGLPPTIAAEHGSYVTLVNVVGTVIALFLVDRLGRTALLKIGTAGIVVAFIAAAVSFHHYESRNVDVTAAVRLELTPAGTVAIPVDGAQLGHPEFAGQPTQLTVLYREAGKEKLATEVSSAPDPYVRLRTTDILRASFGPLPGKAAGDWTTVCLMLFIAAFSVGPGVCVWLALSELMPTRIRSWGMGIGLFINQFISTGIAALFLPFVGNFGYAAIFLVWGGFTVLYFLVAAFLLPETKGRTLEEIEAHFAR